MPRLTPRERNAAKIGAKTAKNVAKIGAMRGAA
jgi:hypothetical protein